MIPTRNRRVRVPARAVATVTGAVLALAALPPVPASADAAPVSIAFDAAPAVVGQSVATAYPQVRFNPDPTANNLSYACAPIVVADASPSSPPNAVVPICPGGEFAAPGGLLGVLDSGSTASVSLRFGGYGVPLATTPFVLEAFDSGNELVASATADGAPGWLTVTAAQPTITSFRIRPTNGGIGFRFWVDDISWTPASVPLPPDFRLTRQPGGVLGLLEGATSPPQPLSVTPVNGSAGQVAWSVTGLPAGVTAEVTPTSSGGSLTFTTADGTNGTTGTVTVTAAPVDAATGSTPHSVTVDLSVSSALVLSPPARIDAPVCGPVPIGAVAFGPSTPGRLTLALTKQIPGLSVSLQTRFLDGDVSESPTQSPLFVTGANVDSESFSVLLRVDAAKLTKAVSKTGLTVTLSGGGRTLTRKVPLVVRRPVLTVSPATVRPQREVATVHDPNTPPFDRLKVAVKAPVRLCPGTTIKVGAAASYPPDLALDGSYAQLTVPRDATSGTVRVQSPGFGTVGAGPVTVETFRSAAGFAFDNYRPGFDLGDMWEAFGWDVFFKITLFPGFDLPTPIPSPEAGILLGVANTVFDGACFGISRLARDLLAHPKMLSLFSPKGAADAWHLEGPDGPTEALRHRIAALHLTQMSTQFLASYLDAKAVSEARTPDQLRAAIYEARRIGDIPFLMLDGGGHHVVLVYDVRPAGPGAWDIDVYDPNLPFTPAERAATPKAQLVHANALAESTVHLAANGDWSLAATELANTGMRGLVLMTAGMIPSKASMIKLAKPGDAESALIALFGGGASANRARITSMAAGGRSMTTAPSGTAVEPSRRLAAAPLLDADGTEAGEGWVVDASGGPVEVSVTGTGSGTYRQTVLADGFGGSVALPSAAGRTAALTYDPAAGSVAVAHAAAPGTVVVETAGPDGHGGTRTAALRLPGTSPGTQTVAVTPAGDVVVQHSGPAVDAVVSLSSMPWDTTRSATARVSLGTGTTTLTPVDWGRLSGALTVAGPTGTAQVELRPARTPTVRAVALSVRSVGRTRVATVRVVGRGIGRSDRVSVAWSAVRGSTVVARDIGPVVGRRGAARASWRMPASSRGTRIVAVPILTRTQGLTVTTVAGRPAAGR